MSDSQGILLFTTSSTAGSASSEYDREVFQDVSLPASNNTGFTSTISTNPLNGYFADDMAPKWMAKTLWIRDLQRVEDRTLWVNGRATYKIIWNESFPGVDGYAFGAIGLQGTAESRYVTANDAGDGVGVSGVIQRVQWIVRPKAGTATATPSLDGLNLTAINFGGYTGLGTSFATTKPVYNAYTIDTSNASLNIHDYRLTADQSNTLEVVGLVAYFNVPGDGINAFAGSGFVDKVITNPSGTTLSYPLGVSNLLGGVDSIFVNSNGVFGITSSPTPGVGANCSGASGTNLLSVAIGSGSSFPIGTAILIPSGVTYYLGQVVNVSGDVLTIGPTLAFGVSNICSALFNAGASFAINQTTMQQAFSFQPGVDIRYPAGNSGLPSEYPYSFSDSANRFRAWGSTLRLLSGTSLFTGLSGSTLGLLFPTTSDFLQFEGKFSALEFEYMVGQSALISATLSIDGMYTQGITIPISGPTVIRRSVFANGAFGFHSVRYGEAGSTNALLTRITAYQPKTYQGPSYGLLAEIPTGITFLTRNAQNASLMALGNVERIYAESLRCSGASWGSSATLTAPGGRVLTTIGVGDFLEFQYFGTQFSVAGTVGTSAPATVDGVSSAISYNAWNGSGLTLGFHTVRITNGSSLSIASVDFLSPVHQVRNKQNYDSSPNLNLMPRMWSQASEPLNARLGDVWEQNVQNRIAYQRIFGGWQPMLVPTRGASFALPIITRQNLPVVNQQVSASSGTFVTASTSYVNVTNLNVTITTTGRPVMLMIQSISSAAYIGADRGSASVQFAMRFTRDGNSISSDTQMQSAAAGASSIRIDFPASFSFLDHPEAGTYTYRFQVIATGAGAANIYVQDCRLVAFEL